MAKTAFLEAVGWRLGTFFEKKFGARSFIAAVMAGTRSLIGDAAVADGVEFYVSDDPLDGREEVFEDGHPGVAERRHFYARKEKLGAHGQGLAIDLGAATDKDFAVGQIKGLHLVERVDELRALDVLRLGGAGEDDGVAARQGIGHCVPGFASHEQDVAHGGFFEKLELLANAPGQVVPCADDAVLGHGGDSDPVWADLRAHASKGFRESCAGQ